MHATVTRRLTRRLLHRATASAGIDLPQSPAMHLPLPLLASRAAWAAGDIRPGEGDQRKSPITPHRVSRSMGRCRTRRIPSPFSPPAPRRLGSRRADQPAHRLVPSASPRSPLAPRSGVAMRSRDGQSDLPQSDRCNFLGVQGIVARNRTTDASRLSGVGCRPPPSHVAWGVAAVLAIGPSPTVCPATPHHQRHSRPPAPSHVAWGVTAALVIGPTPRCVRPRRTTGASPVHTAVPRCKGWLRRLRERTKPARLPARPAAPSFHRHRLTLQGLAARMRIMPAAPIPDGMPRRTTRVRPPPIGQPDPPSDAGGHPRGVRGRCAFLPVRT